MRLLLDTCAFLWLATEPSKLSQAATEALNNEQNELFLSDASIWEMTLKHRAGRLPLPDTPRGWIPAELQFHGVQTVAIVAEAIFLASELRSEHRDPFDRLIGAHAAVGSFTVVSPDDAFREFELDCLW